MYKQAIVVRKDLGMGVGKLAAQCSHASLSAYQAAKAKSPDIATTWEQGGQKKIVLKVQSEQELLDYFEKCKRARIPVSLIRDAGNTQLDPGTITCFGAGPWDEKEIDTILGMLKLL